MKKIERINTMNASWSAFEWMIVAKFNEFVDALQREGEKCLQPVPLYDGVGGIKSCQNTEGSCPVHDKQIKTHVVSDINCPCNMCSETNRIFNEKSYICDMCKDTGMINKYTREDGGYILDGEEVCLCKKI